MLGLLSAGGLLGIWLLSFETQLIPYLPSPWEVAAVLVEHRSRLLEGAAYTFGRGSLGFIIGSSLGVVVAVIMGWNRYVRAFAAPLIYTGRTIPVLALIPLFILWFGTGEKSIVPFIALGCFFVVFVVAFEAIATVPQTYMWAAATLGSEPAAIYRRVVMPAITPSIVGGLRVAVTLAFPLALAAEFLGAQQGLGFYVIKATQLLQVADMIAGVLAISVLAIVGDALVRLATRKVTRWSEREEGGR
jgi:ABC-type nitrate/sulfonate/bicarbonate transport system permease component